MGVSSHSSRFVEKYLRVEQLIIVIVLDLPAAGDHLVDVRGIADKAAGIEEPLLVVFDQRIIVLYAQSIT
jgi:hypothetical protein